MSDDFARLVADVYELAGALRQSGEALAATEGQTQARWQLLSAVSGPGLSVAQAARRLGVSRQAVQRVANDLVAEGLVEFIINPDHRTSPIAALTDRGQAALAAIDRRARTSNRRLTEEVGAHTIATARDGLRQILAAVTTAE